MGIKDQIKQHLANKSPLHHLKGKAIEIGLYAAADSVKLNEPAPRNISLWTLNGEKVSLDSVIQQHQNDGKMTLLNIGSFTCPVWRERQGNVQALATRYSDHLACITVYVREAHASDEWTLDMNEKSGISYPMPKTLEERLIIARRAKEELMDANARVYVDDVQDNTLNRAYAAVPIRICVIDTRGNLVFRTKGTGPFGYKPEEFASFLEKTMGPVKGVEGVIRGDLEDDD